MNPQSDHATPILLVDDDSDFRFLARHALREIIGNGPIYEARSGEEALRFVRGLSPFEHRPLPALIFLDFELPGVSGIQVLRTLKEDAATRDIPVVMLTSRDGAEDEDAARKLGAASYCLKKSDPAELLQTISGAAQSWLVIAQESDTE